MAFNTTISWYIKGELTLGNPESDPSKFPPVGVSNRPLYELFQNTEFLKTAVEGDFVPKSEFQSSVVDSILNWDKVFNIPSDFITANHNHDDLYYRKLEIDSLLDQRFGFSDLGIVGQSVVEFSNVTNIPSGIGSNTISILTNTSGVYSRAQLNQSLHLVRVKGGSSASSIFTFQVGINPTEYLTMTALPGETVFSRVYLNFDDNPYSIGSGGFITVHW